MDGKTALSLAGPLLQVAGGVGEVASSAKASRENLKLGKVAAQQRLVNADLEVQQIQRLAKQIQGKQEAKIGAAGIAPTGTALEVMLDTAMQLELEKKLVERGAKMESDELRRRGYLASAAVRGGIPAGLAKIAVSLGNKNVTTWLQDLQTKAAKFGRTSYMPDEAHIDDPEY